MTAKTATAVVTVVDAEVVAVEADVAVVTLPLGILKRAAGEASQCEPCVWPGQLQLRLHRLQH